MHVHIKSKHIVNLRDGIPGNSQNLQSRGFGDVVPSNLSKSNLNYSHSFNGVKPNREVYLEKKSSSVLKSTFEFVFMTSFIFILLFGLSNYSAYKEIFQYWYRTEVMQAEKQETAIDDIIGTNDKNNAESLVFGGDNLEYINFPIRPSDYRIYIPKIDKNLPVVRTSNENLLKKNWDELEKNIQEDLRKGVVHYPGTANAGEIGNLFLTAHSSWYPNDPLPFGLSSAFALIDKLVSGDNVYVFDRGNMYIYKVRDKYVVKPTTVSVLDQPVDKREMTLMTCTPVGTALNRLIIKLDLIYPAIEGDGVKGNTEIINPYSEGRLQS